MIDLHCHILPAVDDGAQSLEEALRMCRLAAADGCSAMIATPHQRRPEWWNGEREKLHELADELSRAVPPGFSVHLGGEIHVDSALLSAVDRFEESGILPLAGSRYLLIEFPWTFGEDQALDLVYELGLAGWRPIVAHPEFIPWLADDPGLLAQLIGQGATAQVTAMSVTGDFGKRPQRCTHALLEADLVHFVASDSHDTRNRPPGLSRAREVIAGRWGRERAERLTVDHPRAVVEDRPLALGLGEAF